ncbi:hypothetical protein [Nocardia gipuzkoensis]
MTDWVLLVLVVGLLLFTAAVSLPCWTRDDPPDSVPARELLDRLTDEYERGDG